MSIFTSYLQKVLPDPPSDSRLVVFNTATGALFFRAYMKLLPKSHAQTLSVVSSPTEVFEELENPCDFPEWFERGGRRYTLSSETHGEYEMLLDRCAFARLRVCDIYNVSSLSAPGSDDASIEESPEEARCTRPRRSSTESRAKFMLKSGSMDSSWSGGSSSSFLTANDEYLI
mmetsp:Transcript_31682/g.77578  ORF Transcript_31682/g.77578 Transcript_31682/m.77578 type:complete len:173 (+) Transcript_31682:1-519(+)